MTVTFPDASDMMAANRLQSETLLYPMDAMILSALDVVPGTERRVHIQVAGRIREEGPVDTGVLQRLGPRDCQTEAALGQSPALPSTAAVFVTSRPPESSVWEYGMSMSSASKRRLTASTNCERTAG